MFYQSADAARELRRSTRFDRVTDFVGTFLEVRSPHNYERDVCVQIEMPGNLTLIRIESGSVVVHADLAQTLIPQIAVIVAPDNLDTRERVRPDMEVSVIERDSATARVSAVAHGMSWDYGDRIEILLRDAHNGIDIDRDSGFVWRFVPHHERNPLLATARRFRAFSDARLALQQGFAGRKRAAEELVAATALVFSLLGCRVVNFGRADTIIDNGVVRGTCDLLAYHAESHTVLAVECTINPPKTEDYDKVVHAAETLAREFPTPSQVMVVPVLVTAQSNDPIGREAAARHGIRMWTSTELADIFGRLDGGEMIDVAALRKGGLPPVH